MVQIVKRVPPSPSITQTWPLHRFALSLNVLAAMQHTPRIAAGLLLFTELDDGH